MKKRSRVKTVSRIRGSKAPERIVMKFCMMVGLPDVVTRARLDGDRFRHFRVVGVEFQVFSVDFDSRPYNTLALPCQIVMKMWDFSRRRNTANYLLLTDDYIRLSVCHTLVPYPDE